MDRADAAVEDPDRTLAAVLERVESAVVVDRATRSRTAASVRSGSSTAGSARSMVARGCGPP
jgi:hypothetical protein